MSNMDQLGGDVATGGDISDQTPAAQNVNKGQPPSNADILDYLKTMNGRITQMDEKLGKLDLLEKQVSSIDTDLKKLWVFVHDNINKCNESVSTVTQRVDSIVFDVSSAADEITKLRKDRDTMQGTIEYLQSQSMRNNLIFTNIEEDPNERQDATESKLRTFLTTNLKLAQDSVDSVKFERVHRVGSYTTVSNKPRNIVAKFTLFKDRELVRQARSVLKGTLFYINEQFPKEVADRRRALQPKLREALRDKKKAWISYDTLYVDGRPVRGNSH